MTFTFKNLKTLNSLMLAGVLATAGVSAMAQSPAPVAAPATTMQQAEPGAGHHKMGQRDPAKMQAWMAKRQAEMKTRLKITAPQEGAWNTFTAAMQPSGHSWGQRDMTAQRAELAKLTTPERIDKMREMRTQRAEATKTFYATLTPEQQKTFDAEQLKMMQKQGYRQHEEGMHR